MGTARAQRVDTQSRIRKTPVARVQGHTLTLGRPVANAVIVGIIPGDVLSNNRYKLKNNCCGSVTEMSYAVLRQAAKNDQRICKACADALRTAGHTKQLRTARLPTPGARDATGRLWPHLGKLGPRFGMQPYQAALSRGQRP